MRKQCQVLSKVRMVRTILKHQLRPNWTECGQYGGQYRQLESATITDKLITYTDKSGKTRTAVLDTTKSEGWVDNGDGKQA